MDETNATQQPPAEIAPPRTLPVDRVVSAIRGDCQDQPVDYLVESQAPGGGE